MSYEMKDGTGSLFKNERKETPQHSDYNGSVKVDGVEYWLNAWLKEGKNGKKYMSLSLKAKEAKASAPVKPAPVKDEFDDVLGF